MKRDGTRVAREHPDRVVRSSLIMLSCVYQHDGRAWASSEELPYADGCNDQYVDVIISEGKALGIHCPDKHALNTRRAVCS